MTGRPPRIGNDQPAVLEHVPAKAMALTAAAASSWHRDAEPDDSHPLLKALSGWQADVSATPLYPAIAELWIEKFDGALAGMRLDWIVGRARDSGHPASGIEEYLEHTDSVLISITAVPRWITYEHGDLSGHLEALVAALEDVTLAVRPANDLAADAWEKPQDGQNNIMMYGASPEWVAEKTRRRTEAVKQRLALLTAVHFLFAVELVRRVERSAGFYALADFRNWTADEPATARCQS